MKETNVNFNTRTHSEDLDDEIFRRLNSTKDHSTSDMYRKLQAVRVAPARLSKEEYHSYGPPLHRSSLPLLATLPKGTGRC